MKWAKPSVGADQNFWAEPSVGMDQTCPGLNHPRSDSPPSSPCSLSFSYKLGATGQLIYDLAPRHMGFGEKEVGNKCISGKTLTVRAVGTF